MLFIIIFGFLLPIAGFIWLVDSFKIMFKARKEGFYIGKKL